MNEDALNTSIRSFLKRVGINAQREIEKAVRAAADSGDIKPGTKWPARMVLTVEGLDLTLEINGEINSG
jgi:hypothetical protein